MKRLRGTAVTVAEEDVAVIAVVVAIVVRLRIRRMVRRFPIPTMRANTDCILTILTAVAVVAVGRYKEKRANASAFACIFLPVKEFLFKSKNFTQNNTVKKLKSTVIFLKKKYDLLSMKKYTTIAGTLVFFLIMSVVPFTFWLTLVFGKFQIGTEGLLKMNVFESVQEILLFISEEAKNATTGASVFLVLTTLYSSTNLFYQLRKAGELVYEYKNRTGISARFSALVLLFLSMAFLASAIVVLAIGSFFSARIFSATFEGIFNYLLLIAVAFFLVLLLNAYVCPYAMPIKIFLPGSFVTILSWTLSLVGFAIYLRLGNVTQLYGALSAVIVFLLWLYVLMICFVVGVIVNSERVLSLGKYRRKSKRFF